MPSVTQADEWQWKAAKGITEGRFQKIVLAATGSGKSMVWIRLLLAMKMYKQSGILILFGVTKAILQSEVSDVNFSTAYSCWRLCSSTLSHPMWLLMQLAL